MKYKLKYEIKKEDYSRVIYGDSVTGDTPLLLKKDDNVYIETISSIFDEKNKFEYPLFKFLDDTIRIEKEYSETDYQIWTDLGWVDIKKVIRHRTNKKIYRISTENSSVKVTADHSLLDEFKNKIKPTDCNLETNLLTSYPLFLENEKYNYLSGFLEKINGSLCKKVPGYILNSNKYLINCFLRGYTKNTSYTDIDAARIYYLKRKAGYNMGSTRGKIEKIEYIETSESQYVYDIETEAGRFQAGFGNIIVSNTDSCMIELKTPSFKKFKELTEKFKNLDELSESQQAEFDGYKTQVIVESFDLGKILANEITKTLFKYPISLEFEKVYYPFISLSKKRYIGNYYGTSPYNYDYTEKKGVVLKRRDNPEIVKKVYNGVINPILKDGARGVNLSIKFLKEQLRKLMNNDVDLNDLVITKTLAKGYGKICSCKNKVPCELCTDGILKGAKDYASLNLPHVALAIKMRQRDIGSAPVVNDRISYVFVEIQDKPKAKLYEQVEDLQYAIDNKLTINFAYYVDNQLKNPIKEVLDLMMSDSDAFFDEVTSEYKMELKEKIKKAKIKDSIPKGQTSILKWLGK